MRNDEQEQITIARALLKYRIKEKMAIATANTPNALPFPKKIPMQETKQTFSHPPVTGSKILPLIRPKSAPRNRPSVHMNDALTSQQFATTENRGCRSQKFPTAGAAPYVPVRHYQNVYHGMAPPVTIRTAVPVFSAPPHPPPPGCCAPPGMGPGVRMAPAVNIRSVVPVFAAPPSVVRIEDPPPVFPAPTTLARSSIKIEEKGNPASSTAFVAPPLPTQTSVKTDDITNLPGPPVSAAPQSAPPSVRVEETSTAPKDMQNPVIQNLQQLKI